MLTLIMLCLLVIVIFVIIAFVTGIMAIAPALLVIAGFILLDYLIIKAIFRKKK